MPLVESDTYCTQCRKSSQQAGSPIKKCSKCRIVGYCSVACQSAAWKAGHKFECYNPEDLDLGSRRATARLQMGGLLHDHDCDQDHGDDGSTIYYLKVTRPWIADICISGPYRSVEETFPNIALNLRFSRSGMIYFDQLVREVPIGKVSQLRAPLDADKEKVILIEFLQKEDSQLKAHLPGRVWTVVSGKLASKSLVKTLVPLEELDLVGSFLSGDEAEAAARAELETQASLIAGSKTMFHREGGFGGAVLVQGKIERVVEVMRDSGEADESMRYGHAT